MDLGTYGTPDTLDIEDVLSISAAAMLELADSTATSVGARPVSSGIPSYVTLLHNIR